ncbi:hypothetical protein [Streptomyces sp. S1]|uniref:hypothetical protein n=1 Tax=Streptomyces sp. S1 TaxID=718288 RepID=UPI003D740B35
MKRKPRVHGYRSTRTFIAGWSDWRYRCTCPCGWSYDTPAEYFDSVLPNLAFHRKGCHR